MANNDENLDIELGVGASVVPGTGKKVEKEMQNELDKIKDLTIPINKKNIKLTKAQKEVTDIISDLINKGFSSAGKDPKGKLDSALNTFLEEAKKEGIYGRGKKNDTISGIKNQVTELKHQITEWKKLQKAEKTYATKIQKNASKPKKARYIRDTDEDAKIQHAIKRHEAELKEKREESEKIERAIEKHEAELQNKEYEGKSTSKSGVPRLRQSYLDPGMTNEYQQAKNEYSSHGNKNYAIDDEALMKANRELAKEIKTWKTKPGEDVEKLARELRESDSKIKHTIQEPKVVPIKRGRGRPRKNNLEPQYEVIMDTVSTWEDTMVDVPGRLSGSTKKLDYLKSKMDKSLSELKATVRLLEDDKDVFSDGSLHDKVKVALKLIGDYYEEKDKGIIAGRLPKGASTAMKLESALQSIYTLSNKKLIGYGNDEEQGIGPGHEKALTFQKDLQELLDEISHGLRTFEPINDNVADIHKEVKKATKVKTVRSSYNKDAKEISEKYSLDEVVAELKNSGNSLKKAVAYQTDLDRLENDRQAVLQNEQVKEAKSNVSATEKQTDVVSDDAATGFDTDVAKDALLTKTTSTNRILSDELNHVLQSIDKNVALIRDRIGGKRNNGDLNLGNSKQDKSSLPSTKIWNEALGKFYKSNVVSHDKPGHKFVDITDYEKLFSKINKPHAVEAADKQYYSDIEEHIKKLMGTAKPEVSETNVITTWTKPFKNIFDSLYNILTGSISKADEMLAKNQKEQEQIQTERLEKFGFADTGKNVTRTGDKVGLTRVSNLWRQLRGGGTINPFENLKITEGFGEIDSIEITKALSKSIEQNMFKAQTGGWKRNLAMVATAGLSTLWQPSLEKSRAEIDAFNSIMGTMRSRIGSVVEGIKVREQYLQGMIDKGKARITEDGKIEGQPEALHLFAELENHKATLRGMLADAATVNAITKEIGGNTSRILRHISFASPEFADQNITIHNINAGLTKEGKAIKFQRRAAEILNYTFQLMARSIGQMWKNWMQQLNPITLIKKAFSDFTSYSVKWQRTMNVIKYNLRATIKPMMEKIAQIIVNIIGLVQSLASGILGKKINLFDQAAADSEKIHEELEAAANVSAGFDELHDIGSDNSGANDLMGEIYTPQWKGLQNTFEGISEKLQNIIGKVVLLAQVLTAVWAVIKLISKGLSAIQAIGIVMFIAGVLNAIKGLIDYLKNPSWENFGKIIRGIGLAIVGLGVIFGNLPLILAGVVTILIGIVIGFWDKIRDAIAHFIQYLEKSSDWVHETFGHFIGGIYNLFVSVFKGIFEMVDGVIQGIKDIFDGLIEFLTGVFTGNWEKAWNGLKNIVKGIWDTLLAVITAPFKTIWDWITKLLARKKELEGNFSEGGGNGHGGGGGGGRGGSVPKLASGTNYVRNDGLAYLHQGEAIVPKKYNPALGNQGLTSEERNYMSQMIATMTNLNNTLQGGIPVTGEFKQRGSDLVAIVQKGQNRNGNQPLSNPAYAR